MRLLWTLGLLRLAVLLITSHPVHSLRPTGHVRAAARLSCCQRCAQQPAMRSASHALQQPPSGAAKRLSPYTRPARSNAPALLAKAPMVDRYAFCCYGCGAELQKVSPRAAGFVEPERYELKAKHKQLRQLLCVRCRALAQGQILPAVVEGRLRTEGDGGVTTPEELRAQLLPLRTRKALIVLLVDLVDVAGSMLPRVRDIVGANPILVVGTKADLLPKGTDVKEVEAWLAQLASSRLGGVLDVRVCSSKSADGVIAASTAIRNERAGRDVFILGAANVGKSAFIAAFLDSSYAGRPKRLPISSETPGTTLAPVAIDAFSGGSQMYDTPGVHLAHRMQAQLLPEELRRIIPKGKLKPYTPRLTGGGVEGLDEGGSAGFVGSTFFWGGLVRFDVKQAPLALRLTFFSAGLGVHRVPTSTAAEAHAARAGVDLTPPMSPQSAAQLGELLMRKSVALTLEPMAHTADIAVSGLGWVAVSCLSTLDTSEALVAEIDVWVPRSVEVSVRAPMPVGGIPTNTVDSKAKA